MNASGEAGAPGSVEQFVAHVRAEIGKIVIGQDEMVEQCMVALLVGGHVLLEGVPGLAKTLAVKTIARLLTLDFSRVQCTSDLMPADILGTNILQQSSATFQLHRGPIFAHLLLVDEINRMPPRTQAALLEAMEERQVTIDGKRYQLDPYFTVFATQNPVEFEGTYPLPEAQLDRFLLNCSVPYPSQEDEVKILQWHQTGSDQHLPRAADRASSRGVVGCGESRRASGQSGGHDTPICGSYRTCYARFRPGRARSQPASRSRIAIGLKSNGSR